MATWGNTLIGQSDYVDNAYNRARAQWDAGKDAAIRQAGRMGINPNSGAFMNMLNNAQYDATAGANAAANAADTQWLSAAQDQFNRDRAAGMDQQRIDNQNNQWWANLANREMNLYYGQNGQNGRYGQVGQNTRQAAPVMSGVGFRSMSNRYNPRRPFDWTGYTYNPKNFPTWR